MHVDLPILDDVQVHGSLQGGADARDALGVRDRGVLAFLERIPGAGFEPTGEQNALGRNGHHALDQRRDGGLLRGLAADHEHVDVERSRILSQGTDELAENLLDLTVEIRDIDDHLLVQGNDAQSQLGGELLESLHRDAGLQRGEVERSFGPFPRATAGKQEDRHRQQAARQHGHTGGGLVDVLFADEEISELGELFGGLRQPRQDDLLDDGLDQAIAGDGGRVLEEDLGVQLDGDAFLLVLILDDGDVGGAAADIQVHDAELRHLAAGLPSVDGDPVLPHGLTGQAVDGGVDQGELASHRLVHTHLQFDLWLAGRQIGRLEDADGFHPLCPVLSDFRAGPAGGEGRDDVTDGATMEGPLLLGPVQVVDLAMGRLHDGEHRPGQGIAARETRAGRRGHGTADHRPGAGQLGTIAPGIPALGLESEHESGQEAESAEPVDRSEDLVAIVGHAGPGLRAEFIVPEVTFGGTLLEQLPELHAAGRFVAQRRRAVDEFLHVVAQADRGKLDEHVRDASLDHVEFLLDGAPAHAGEETRFHAMLLVARREERDGVRRT